MLYQENKLKVPAVYFTGKNIQEVAEAFSIPAGDILINENSATVGGTSAHIPCPFWIAYNPAFKHYAFYTQEQFEWLFSPAKEVEDIASAGMFDERPGHYSAEIHPDRAIDVRMTCLDVAHKYAEDFGALIDSTKRLISLMSTGQ